MTLKKSHLAGAVPLAVLAATFATIVTIAAMTSPLFAQDWPQWRGPNRDGVVMSFSEPSAWPENLTQRWKAEVGLGYASPILIGDRLFVFARQGGDEVMMALEAASGEELWRTSYPAPFQMNPATARHGEGPKSTPTYADGRLFTLGISGIVTAFDAETGRQLWQRPRDSVEPLFHTSMSPIVDGDMMILHVGGHHDGALTAFGVESGNVLWEWAGDGPAYGSPLIVEFEGVRQVVTFTQEHFVGVSLETGQLLWSRPFTTQSTTTSQTPITYEGDVIQTGRGNGITRFQVVREGSAWTTKDLWHTDDVSVHMANTVVVDGVMVGLSHLNSGQYFGLDLDTGQVVWTSDPRQADHASILRSGQTVFSLEDDAELLVLKNSRSAFDPQEVYDVAESATWTLPTLSANRLFVKDVSNLTLWTVD